MAKASISSNENFEEVVNDGCEALEHPQDAPRISVSYPQPPWTEIGMYCKSTIKRVRYETSINLGETWCYWKAPSTSRRWWGSGGRGHGIKWYQRGIPWTKCPWPACRDVQRKPSASAEAPIPRPSRNANPKWIRKHFLFMRKVKDSWLKRYHVNVDEQKIPCAFGGQHVLMNFHVMRWSKATSRWTMQCGSTSKAKGSVMCQPYKWKQLHSLSHMMTSWLPGSWHSGNCSNGWELQPEPEHRYLVQKFPVILFKSFLMLKWGAVVDNSTHQPRTGWVGETSCHALHPTHCCGICKGEGHYLEWRSWCFRTSQLAEWSWPTSLRKLLG